jgi:hypothetical protein
MRAQPPALDLHDALETFNNGHTIEEEYHAGALSFEGPNTGCGGSTSTPGGHTVDGSGRSRSCTRSPATRIRRLR